MELSLAPLHGAKGRDRRAPGLETWTLTCALTLSWPWDILCGLENKEPSLHQKFTSASFQRQEGEGRGQGDKRVLRQGHRFFAHQSSFRKTVVLYIKLVS